MSWESVQAGLNWAPSQPLPNYAGSLSSNDQTFILAYLSQLYVGSPKAREILEAGLTGTPYLLR